VSKARSALDTPMMRQFLAIKAQHPDSILLYRMGDFYEMFLEDAERAAPLLEIALTTRDKGKPDAVPMCGIPVHSADGYVKRLTDAGCRVAVCEQVEDPRKAKKLVKREVVEVVTPGLVGDPAGLDGRQEVALVALVPAGPDGEAGLAALDVSTGDFRAAAVPGGVEGGLPAALVEELERIGPREVLLPEACAAGLAATLERRLPGVARTPLDGERFDPAAVAEPTEGLAADARDPASRAAAALLGYLVDNQPFALHQTRRLRRYALSDAMVLDAATRRHLELFESSEDRSRRGTLVASLDRTATAPGARRLVRWIAYPLLDPDAIAARQDGVAWLAERDRLRARLRKALASVRDPERLFAKAGRPGATPRDLAALREALAALPAVAEALAGDGEDALPGAAAERPAALAPPAPVPEAVRLLAEALVDDPPALPRGSRGAGETGYVREGFRPELDALRDAARKGRESIAGLEARERERTGIPTLKMRFHPVHGYAIEVTKAHLARAPEHYERKQTLANAERFTTPELREIESSVLGANDRAAALEREIFEDVRSEVLGHGEAILAAADAVARVDAVASLAEVARAGGWTRPVVDAGGTIEITAGRHPVIEPLLEAEGGDGFVPNDTRLDPDETALWILTGPNMSGKSTYLRQVALIVLLAQMGSFVPADAARIGIVDRVFTRVGASDRLARGESTFMVEMREAAEILSLASRRSLVILDEIGRGTSTFDGLSIAWSVAEYLHDTPGLCPRTLFATHYHELTDLAATKPRVGNAHFEVREWKDEVVFLRRLAPGGASRSYGIQVARLAGLPDAVIRRAREILANLESGELDAEGRPRLASGEPGAGRGDGQLGLFAGGPPRDPEEERVLDALRELDPDDVTPREALSLLASFRERLGRDES
jgi:DNA mismatch repair protein MutS